MKCIYLIIIVIIFSCGSNLKKEEGEEFRPSELVYKPDSLTLNRNTEEFANSAQPSIDSGSGEVRYEIIFPLYEGLTIDKVTGIVTAKNTLSPNTYLMDIRARNYVGSTTFTKALTVIVK